jgi:hypothetical protein
MCDYDYSPTLVAGKQENSAHQKFLSDAIQRSLRRWIRTKSPLAARNPTNLPAKHSQVMKNPGLRCVEKMPKCSVFSQLAYFFSVLAGMLAELTVGGVEIEPHIVLS